MLNNRWRQGLNLVIVCGAAAGLVYAIGRYRSWSIFRRSRGPLGHKQIKIITNVEECSMAVKDLRRDTASHRVLGFDCEWVTVDGLRRPVALLQLASPSGLCALFRLCHIKCIPTDLKLLLEDTHILKVGVSPVDDAKNLFRDYQVQVGGTVDLRFLAQFLSQPPEGLAKLAKTHVGVDLNKDWRIRCSSWDADELTGPQIEYAADDCMIGIEVFQRFLAIFKKDYPGQGLHEFLEIGECYVNRPFKYKSADGLVEKKNGLTKSNNVMKVQKRNMASRSKPLYDNCFMEAPDGEMLCTMDRVKAEWYRKKGLAVVVNEDPLRMRLTFEPSGRAVGTAGQYYLVPKENICVVCGTKDNCSRKFVIPKEYRKFFPVIMKSHSSHDILLLCQDCHRTSHMKDCILRDELAEMCQAPLVLHFKKMKTYANALLHQNLQPESREMMLAEIKRFHKGSEEIDEELLQNISQWNIKSKHSEISDHAKIVTDYFRSVHPDGLLELEKMWRKHFIDSMQPKHLSDLWSIDHNADRIEIRANEGRLKESELIDVGLDPDYLQRKDEEEGEQGVGSCSPSI